MMLASIDDEHFLERTRFLTSLDKVTSLFRKRKFRRGRQCFLDNFVSAILSTAAPRYLVEQGVNCFCAEFIRRCDKFKVFHLLRQILEEFLGWRAPILQLPRQICTY